MSLIAELKRRNVFRVGIAYAVTAWLLIQVSDILLDSIGAPPWVLQTLFVVLAVGFVIALFFAWAFELTPEGVKRESEVDRSQSIAPQTGRKLNNAILVLMALAIGYLLYDKFMGSGSFTGTGVETVAQTDSEPVNEPDPIATEPAINRRSIAVLPFDNRSDQKSDEYFVEGIHDDLLTNLARIGSLKVISRTSVSKYKDTEKTIPEIAGELKVATVMEGAVQRSGNTVRINVQLIDAKTDEHLWAEIFDRQLTADNLFAIQTEISEAIARALEAKLSPEEQQRISDRPTDNLAAYNAYLRGRQLLIRRTSTDLEQALQAFRQAVDLDPQFALAWVGIAETAVLLPGYSSQDRTEAMEMAGQAVQQALAINDELGEAYLSLAEVLDFQKRPGEADAAYRKSIELSPNYATAYQWYSDFLAQWPNRTREAVRLAGQAVDLDPLSPIMRVSLADRLMGLGRFETARIELQSVLDIDPEFAPAVAEMADLSGETGHFDEQIRWLRKSMELDPGRVYERINETLALLSLGMPEEVDRIKRLLEEADPEHVSNGWIEMLQNTYRHNLPATLEAAQWVNRKEGFQGAIQRVIARLYMMSGDEEKAMQAFELNDPALKDPASWRESIEKDVLSACLYGWLLQRGADADGGKRLVDQANLYIKEELPRYVDSPERYDIGICQLAQGRFDEAIETLEKVVDHGFYGRWWLRTPLPLFDPVRDDPRFLAALAKIDAEMARQRENLARMEKEAGT
jgi:TolB-like protein/Tfp pilus assembly protein PilF